MGLQVISRKVSPLAKVLLVDDEAIARKSLGSLLTDHGHSVYAASSGREAIDLGIRLHPDVLVTDWMLTNSIHGLHVSRVLRAVEPQLQTVLVTGFCSDDLRAEAKQENVEHVLEKPIDPQDIVAAIDEMQRTPADSLPKYWVSVIEFDEAGDIVHANRTAREMYAATGNASFPGSLSELFDEASLAALQGADKEWTEVKPIAPGTHRWIAQVKNWSDGGIVVFLPKEREYDANNPYVLMLLELGISRAGSWPFKEGVLVIDDERMIRMVQTKLLERTGCACYAAETEDLALKLLRSDPNLNIVLLDYTMPNIDVAGLVKKIREIRSSITIVGNSGNVDARAFSEMGVESFLPKPWRVPDLIEKLAKAGRG